MPCRDVRAIAGLRRVDDAPAADHDPLDGARRTAQHSEPTPPAHLLLTEPLTAPRSQLQCRPGKKANSGNPADYILQMYVVVTSPSWYNCVWQSKYTEVPLPTRKVWEAELIPNRIQTMPDAHPAALCRPQSCV